jgi:hypothetical protein
MPSALSPAPLPAAARGNGQQKHFVADILPFQRPVADFGRSKPAVGEPDVVTKYES